MKRHGNLYDRVISIDNLILADVKARKGKSKTKGVIEHDKNAKGNILKLHLSLKNKTFKTSDYKTFKILDPKERIIY